MNNIQRWRWDYILAFIFLILGIFYYTKGYACENPVAMRHMYMYKALVYENCVTNTQKVQFHKENGHRCYNDAKELCWWLPSMDDRKKARYCFTNLGILACPGEPLSKILTALINTLVQYGIDCSDEWNQINTKLYWSQYHFEMMDFYTSLKRTFFERLQQVK